MLVDAHTLQDRKVLETDICIIGGGPAGITLAREFIGHSAHVVCLESGGVEAEQSAQALNAGSLVGSAYAGLQQTRHRQLGGAACIWNTWLPGNPDAARGTGGSGNSGAKYVPLDSSDFAPRPDLHAHWPFARADLVSHYQRAQQICQLGPFVYDASHWGNPRTPFELPDPRVRQAVYQFGSARPFTHSHVEALASADNVQLFYHATACALKLSGNQRDAAGLDGATIAGNGFRVKSRLFVLAGGAIENARLLLASRDPGYNAPGNGYDWLGRCFMEHPRDHSMTLTPHHPELFDELHFYDRHTAADGTVIAGRFGLDPATVLRDNLPNASLTPLPLIKDTPAGLLPRAAARLKNLLGRQISGGYGWSEHSNPARHYQGLQLLLNTEQLPHPDNRVVLGCSRDRFGVPLPELHWRWRESDQVALAKVRGVFTQALQAANMGTLAVNAAVSPDPNAHHHAGTTRMHRQAQHGVVDGDSRVHHVDNVYVAGSSVLPGAGYANPTLTIVALAVRLADHLKQRF